MSLHGLRLMFTRSAVDLHFDSEVKAKEAYELIETAHDPDKVTSVEIVDSFRRRVRFDPDELVYMLYFDVAESLKSEMAIQVESAKAQQTAQRNMNSGIVPMGGQHNVINGLARQ